MIFLFQDITDFPFPRHQKEMISWKRKITLHEIEIDFVLSWKRKIILHEIEIASVLSCKRKIILHE